MKPIFTQMIIVSASLAAVACGALEQKDDFQIKEVSLPVFPLSLSPPAKLSDISYRAFGQFEQCTVTHIGQGLGITAGHCFNAPAHLASIGIKLSPIPVHWGWSGGEKSQTTSSITEILAFEFNEVADWAIVRLYNPPTEFVQLDSQKPLKPTEKLTFFGYPGKSALTHFGLCQVDQSILTGRLVYSCERRSEGGTSGSALMDVQTGKVVGVHNGSLSELEAPRYGTSTIAANMRAFVKNDFRFPLLTALESQKLQPGEKLILQNTGFTLVSFTVRRSNSSILAITDGKGKTSQITKSRFDEMTFHSIPLPVTLESHQFGFGDPVIGVENITYSR